MIIQVENQYRLRKNWDLQWFFTRLHQIFFYQMFLNHSNSYQMSSLRIFYQILTFLDQSDLIDLHFKFLKPVIYCKTKQIVWLKVMVKNIRYLTVYIVTKHYRIVITSAWIQASDENIGISFIAVILCQLQSKLVLWLYG